MCSSHKNQPIERNAEKILLQTQDERQAFDSVCGELVESCVELLISQKYRRHLDVQRMTVPSSGYF